MGLKAGLRVFVAAFVAVCAAACDILLLLDSSNWILGARGERKGGEDGN